MDSTLGEPRFTAAQVQDIVRQAIEPLAAQIDRQHAQLMNALGQHLTLCKYFQGPSETTNGVYHQTQALNSPPQTVDYERDQSAEQFTSKVNGLETLFDGLDAYVRIPNVHALCPNWSIDKNPNLDDVRDEFRAWVNHWFAEQRLRQKVEDLDAPLFAALAYPRTGRRQLLTLAKWIAWYFPWDDAIDDASMKQQPKDVDRYKNETISVIRQSLGPGDQLQEEGHSNPAIQSFWDLGTEIRLNGTLETNLIVAEEQSGFVASAAQSQVERELSEPVSVEEYLKRREVNIAIYPLMALSYYAYSVALPAELLPANNVSMKTMRIELARMGTMANDLLSLRREVINGQYESLVPLLMYHEKLGIQAAVDRSTEMIHESYHRFDEAEKDLYTQVKPEDVENVKIYVASCKDLIMCNLHWSFGLRRYMDKTMVQEDGSVLFRLQLPSGAEAGAVPPKAK